MYVALATTVEEYAGTLANCSVKIESSEDRGPELVGFVCDVEHPSKAVGNLDFGFTLLVVAWPYSRLPRA